MQYPSAYARRWFHLFCSYITKHKSAVSCSVKTGVSNLCTSILYPGKHILQRLPQILAASFLNLDRWTWDKPRVSLAKSAFLAGVHSAEIRCLESSYSTYAGHYLIRNNESSVNALNLRQSRVSVYVVNTTPGWLLAIKHRFKYLTPPSPPNLAQTNVQMAEGEKNSQTPFMLSSNTRKVSMHFTSKTWTLLMPVCQKTPINATGLIWVEKVIAYDSLYFTQNHSVTPSVLQMGLVILAENPPIRQKCFTTGDHSEQLRIDLQWLSGKAQLIHGRLLPNTTKQGYRTPSL